MSTLYSSEQYKLIIDFSDVEGLTNYVVQTGEDRLSPPSFDVDNPDATWTPGQLSGKYIQALHTQFSDGNRGDNPLGNMMSSRAYVTAFDSTDAINPMNTSSSYYGHMVPGRKAAVYKSVDGSTWSHYFDGFITNWQGSFKDGYYGEVAITIEDQLNSIGMMNVTDLAYTGSNAEDALTAIFTAFGLSSSDFVISADLNLNAIPYSALRSPARNTINDICYKALAYISIKQDGKIYVEPLIQAAPLSADHEITANDIGPLTPTNTSAVNFAKVRVDYTSGDGLSYQLLASQTDIKLLNGVTNIVLDSFGKIYSVESVSLTINEEDTPQTVNDVQYSAGDTRITITVDATLDNEKLAKVDVYGLAIGGTQTKSVTITLPNSAIGVQSDTFDYTASAIMTAADAQQLATKIGNFILSLRKQIKIDKTTLSSDVQVGETIEISDVSATYDGVYRVSAVNLEYGETYNVGVTLLKLE